MRIIVSGGTGFIGRALVRNLCERGDDVVVLTRGLHPEGAGGYLGARPTCCRGAGLVQKMRWTPDQRGDWEKVLEGADAVVHLAGAGVFDERWTPERKDVIRSSRIRSTEVLAAAIAGAQKKPSVFISGSAVGYYGISCGDRVVAEADASGDDFLAKLTVDWEAAAEPARRAGVRVCHPRMGIVLGRRGGIFAKMLPVFRAYMGGPVGDGTQFVPWIHQADVVRAIEYAIERENMSGPFNTTAPEPVTMNDFAKAFGEVLDRPWSVRVPALAVKLAFGEGAESVLTGQRAVPRKLVGEEFAFLFPEVASALADLVTEH